MEMKDLYRQLEAAKLQLKSAENAANAAKRRVAKANARLLKVEREMLALIKGERHGKKAESAEESIVRAAGDVRQDPRDERGGVS